MYGSARIHSGTFRPQGSTRPGRKQYLYHERWRAQRDRRKFERTTGWSALRSDELNAYLKELMDDEFSAKDFRTLNATVAAAAALAARNGPARRGSRKRAVRAAVAEVAELVGNTPAVARRSYIDPRVIDRFMAGDTVAAPDLASRAKLERAVLTLLED